MTKIRSGATTDELTIDPTSKALRDTIYDTRGTNRGVKATYRAASVGTFVAAAGTSPFFAIQGSGTKMVRIQRIVISGMNLTAVAYLKLILQKVSSATSGGTKTDLVQTPLESGDAAATLSLCGVYTAAPTAGTLVGTLASRLHLAQSTTAAAAGIPEEIVFDFRTIGEAASILLAGVTQGITLSFQTAPATAVTLAIEVEWTEE